jgi:hypothetical protein
MLLLGGVFALVVLVQSKIQAALIQRGWNPIFAEIAVPGLGAVSVTVASIPLAVVAGQATLAYFKTAAFLLLTIVLIFALQTLLQDFLGTSTLPRELCYYGSWIGAIVAVGWPAERIARWLGIELKVPRDAA